MSSAGTCRTPEELRSQLAGPLREPERLALADHLEACARCRDAAEAILAEVPSSARAPSTVAAGAGHPLVAGLVKNLRAGAGLSHGTVVSPADADATLAAPPPDEAVTMTVPASLPPPGSAVTEVRQLAHYRVLKRLGAGGMGVVYLAEDTRLERQVALKVMRPELAAVPVHEQRFLREARATAKIQNDHIVTIYQVDEVGGVPFLAMQLLQGESLESWLQRGQRPTTGQAARIGREIALGLAAAHARGMVHRDIKPANLWLEAPKGRVKILDFGLARAATGDQNLTSSGVIVGTPAFMAPEQARAGTVDARTDLFSLGVVLYRLCTGQMPFTGPDAMSVMISAALDTPPAVRDLNPEVPPELAGLIGELIEKDPARRPESAKGVARRLARIESDIRRARVAAGGSGGDSLPVAAPQPARGGAAKRARGSVRSVAAVLGVAALAAVAVVALRPGNRTASPATGDDARAPVAEADGPAAPDKAKRPEPAPRPPEHPWEPPPLTVPFRAAAPPGPGADLRKLAFSSDGRKLLAGYKARALEFAADDLRKTESLNFLTGHPEYKGGAAHVAFSPGGHGAALRTNGGAVVVWDVAARKQRFSFPVTGPCHALDFSPEGDGLAIGDDRAVLLREGEKMKEAEPLKGHPAAVSALAFAPHGRKLAVGCKDGTVWLWDLATRKHEDVSPLSREEVLGLAFSQGGKRLAVARAHDTKILHLAPARELFTLRSQGGAAALSPDGRWVAMSDGKRLALFDITGRKRHAVPPDHPDAVTHLVFSPDGHALGAACKDGSLRLWDVTALVDGLSPLFDGRDLAGWRTYDAPAGTFAAEDGHLVATGKDPGWLLTDADFPDFELRLDYRLEEGADSGIAVRAAPQAPALYAMEIQIVDDAKRAGGNPSQPDAPEERSGAVYGLRAPSALNNKKIGEWNRMVVIADHNHVVVEVNGLRVVDHEIDSADRARRPELARTTGRIGLQSRAGRVEFRNLLVKKLTADQK